MPGKVFVSCGQLAGREENTAKAVKQLLSDKFHLSAYVAKEVQSLTDILTITRELRSADYYLFIDFHRKPRDLPLNPKRLWEHLRRPKHIPCSLFTHQELALAHHMKFERFIALQEQGAPLEGMMKYVLGNPKKFRDKADLLRKIENLVSEQDWRPDYSRNLVIEDFRFAGTWNYRDHTTPPYGNPQSIEGVW